MTGDEVICFRCEQQIPYTDMDRICGSAPDAGPHEGYAPVGHRARGWSLHVADCPRARPILVGMEQVDAACTCRRVTA